jgi:hypothetical protein
MRKDNKSLKKENEEYVRTYQAKYKGYRFQIEWTDSRLINPDNEAADVTLETKAGQQYTANFVALSFLDYVFEKNKRTGECASGTYFAMPGMILIRRIDEPSIKATIDDLIKNLEVEEYFKAVD